MLVAPAIVLLSMVVAGPFVYVIWQSFFEKGGAGATLANYDWFLGPDFWPTLKHGLVMYDALYTWCRQQAGKA